MDRNPTGTDANPLSLSRLQRKRSHQLSFAKHSGVLSHSYWCDQCQLKHVLRRMTRVESVVGRKFNLQLKTSLNIYSYCTVKLRPCLLIMQFRKSDKVKTNFERARAVNIINHAQLDQSRKCLSIRFNFRCPKYTLSINENL